MITEIQVFKNLFLSLGFSEEDIYKIINSYSFKEHYEEPFINNIRQVYNYLSQYYNKEELVKMITSFPPIIGLKDTNIKQKIEEICKLGCTKEEAIKILKTAPSLYGLSISNINEKVNCCKKIGFGEDTLNIIKKNPHILAYSINTIESKIKDLNDIGYSDSDIIKMVKDYPYLITHTIKINYSEDPELTKKENLTCIEQKINNLISIGFNKQESLRITRLNPSIFGYSKEAIENKIEEMKKLGFKDEQVFKVIKSSPIILSYSIENINEKILYLVSNGYTRENAVKMISNTPSIIYFTKENIENKIDNFISIGYAKEDVIKMTSILPTILSLSIENIQQKINNLMSLGYTKEEVISMTLQLESLFCYSFEGIKEKVEFFKSFGLEPIITNNTKQLMQSVDLNYARYMFYREIGIDITMDNYKKLFIPNTRFEKQYGVTKKDILKKYKYEDYLKENNNGKTI